MNRDADIELIRRVYEIWASGDLDGLFALLDPEVEWVPPPTGLEHRPVRGHDEVRRVIDSYFESFEEFRMVPEHILAAAQAGSYLALVKVHARGRGSGVELTIEPGHLITIREGKLVRMVVIPNQSQAIEAAGLEPGDLTS